MLHTPVRRARASPQGRATSLAYIDAARVRPAGSERSRPRARVHLVGSAGLVRVVSIVCAALSVGPLLGGCGAPQGVGVPAFAATALPAAADGRKTRVTFALPNGVTVILEENHVTPVVALQAWIGAGAAAEPAGQGGLAHLTERVVLGGARDSAADVAPPTAWTSFDQTVFQTVVAAPLAVTRLEAFGAMLARATFDADEIARARANVLGELRRAATSPAEAVTQALFGAAFGGHAYGRPILGAEASLAPLTSADVAAFHGRAYAGANVTFVAVGDFDARAFRDRVAAALAALPKADGPAALRSSPPALAGPRAVVVAGEAGEKGEGRLAVGFRLPTLDADELAAVDVLAVTLAQGDAGRLPRELVYNRQVARAARASVFHARDGGLLVLDLSLVAGRFEEAARVALAEASRAGREELEPAALEAARAALEADLARGQETAAGYARKLGFFATIAGDAGFEDRYLERLRGLTGAQVRSVAEKLVRPSNVALAALALAPAAAGRSSEDVAESLRALAASETGASPRATAPASVTSFGNVVRVMFPSGMRVLVLRDPTASTVVVHAIWSGGLRLEDARSNGATSLLAATLPRGTRTRDAARLAADFRALGGGLSAAAGRDELGVRVTFLARRWEEGVELLADCLRHPAFLEEEVDRARRAALERVRDHEDDADAAATRLYAATLWPGHPYRLPLLGTAASLSALTRRRLADHFQRYYGASTLTIAVVGDVDAERIAGKLRALFADAPAPLVKASSSPPPARTTDAPTEIFALAAKDQAHVVVGYAGLTLADPERRAAEVLVEILGGPGGRLARELGGTSLVDASAWSGVDGGALVFDLASTPAALEDAVSSLRAALARVVATAFTPAELEGARAALVGADARALEDRGAVAAALARDEALGLGAGAYRRAAAELAAVTPEAVARVARRLIDPRLEIVAVVRPPLPPAVAKATPTKKLSKAEPGPASGGRRAQAP
jgi:zinc protease